MKLNDIIFELEKIYPLNYQESWDNCGLQIGNKNQKIKKIMTTLEITNEVIDEAIKENIDLIITHHPLIFKPLKNILDNKLIKLIQNNICVYAMHTNVDIAINGMNDWLCEEIGLKNIYQLNNKIKEELIKFNVDVKKDQHFKIKELLKKYIININALHDYQEELFNLNAKTIKVISKENLLIRLEFITLKKDKDDILNIFHQNHLNDYYVQEITDPYLSLGIGRIGTIKKQKATDFFNYLNKIYPNTKMITKENKDISTVAIVGGSGISFLDDAIKQNIDCFLTGDIKYHDAQYILENDIVVFDIGHYAEKIFNVKMEEIIKYLFPKLIVCSTKKLKDPFIYE